MSDIASSLQYLSDCSEESLESFELSRLNRASNLRKELSQVAEEWVDAEVSFRLARLLVDRRRPDPRTVTPRHNLPQALSMASRGQLTLHPRFPCDTADADATIERISAPSSITVDSQLHAKNKKEQCLRAFHGAGASGAKRSLRATNETPRSTRRGIPRTPTNPIAAVAGFEPPRTVDTAPSVQAATELKALNAIASGPPEMHPNPTGAIATPLLRFRFGFRAELAQTCVTFSRPPTRAQLQSEKSGESIPCSGVAPHNITESNTGQAAPTCNAGIHSAAARAQNITGKQYRPEPQPEMLELFHEARVAKHDPTQRRAESQPGNAGIQSMRRVRAKHDPKQTARSPNLETQATIPCGVCAQNICRKQTARSRNLETPESIPCAVCAKNITESNTARTRNAPKAIARARRLLSMRHESLTTATRAGSSHRWPSAAA